MVARVAGPRWLVWSGRSCGSCRGGSCGQAAVAAIPSASSFYHCTASAQRKVAECSLALISSPPPNEDAIAQKGGRCPATVESPLWPEWSACPPAMLWLWRG
jgi:hypothetical protein